MSARNSRLRRCAVGCTTTSIGRPDSVARSRSARLRWSFALAGVKGMSAAMPGSSQFAPVSPGKLGACAFQRGGVDRRIGGIGDQGRHMSYAMSGPKTSRGRSAVLIAGPTASGKSALALAVAERLGGVIVNTDSMQVYRDLRIITARPSVADEARVPHRLYGHVDAAENYSVGRWCQDARAVLRGGQERRTGADPGRRHRALFQGADPGAFGGAADAAGYPRRGAGALRCRGRSCAARRARPSRSRHGGAAQARRRDADRTRAGGAGGDRAVAGGLAPRRPAGDPRSRRGREDLSGRRPRRVVPPDRRPVRRHAGGRRAATR